MHEGYKEGNIRFKSAAKVMMSLVALFAVSLAGLFVHEGVHLLQIMGDPDIEILEFVIKPDLGIVKLVTELDYTVPSMGFVALFASQEVYDTKIYPMEIQAYGMQIIFHIAMLWILTKKGVFG